MFLHLCVGRSRPDKDCHTLEGLEPVQGRLPWERLWVHTGASCPLWEGRTRGAAQISVLESWALGAASWVREAG